MAGEEEMELRDLVAHTLETKGVLGKIRAQLRASVFLALEEQESQEKPHPLTSSKFQQYLKTKEGQVATALVREFLSYFELDCTCSVFDPETNALDTYPGRDNLAKDLGLNDTSTDGPLISQVLLRAHSSVQSAAPTSTANPNPSSSSLSISTATAPLDAASAPSSLKTSLGGDRQPVSEHQVSSIPPSIHSHRESHDSILQAGENNFVKPTNSSKGESNGGASSSESSIAGSNHRSGGNGEHLKPTNENNLDVNGSSESPSHPGIPTTNGLVGIGDSTGHLQSIAIAGTGLTDGHHRVDFNEEIEEEIPISESQSNSEQNTDDFFGTKSSSRGGGSKGEYSYEDDFHSDISSKSETNDKLQAARHKKYEETEDYTFSESSFGADLDFVEPAKT